jgi:hypothetical protein
MTMKVDNYLKLSACTAVFISGRGRFPLPLMKTTQYITYLNIWGVLSRNVSSLSTHDHDNEETCLESAPPYTQVSDVLCYKLIPIIYRTSLLQNSLKVIIISYSYFHDIFLM